MTAAWHASTVHALVTAGRDYLAERREDIFDALESFRDVAIAPLRIDNLARVIGRLTTRLDLADKRDADTQASFDHVTSVLESFDARIKALEAATDRDGR